MAFFYSPNVVTDGLIFAVDAADKNSYPGSGTAWTDLAGSNDGTLTNGPTFDSGNGGSFSFDGANDITILDISNIFPTGNQSHNLSVNCWVKVPNTTTGQIFLGNRKSNDRLWLGMYSATWLVGWGNGYQAGTISATTNWTNVCASISNGVATVYVNGVSDATRTDTSVTIDSTFPIGAYINVSENMYDTNNSHPNSISNVSFYNRSLSTSEITQNYNALKGRFGL